MFKILVHCNVINHSWLSTVGFHKKILSGSRELDLSEYCSFQGDLARVYKLCVLTVYNTQMSMTQVYNFLRRGRLIFLFFLLPVKGWHKSSLKVVHPCQSTKVLWL